MHLLPIESGTLDELASAVEIAQTPADMFVLSFSDSDLAGLAAAWERAATLPSLRLTSLKQLRHPLSVDLYIDRALQHAKVIIVRALGGLDYWRYGFERLAALARAHGIALIALPGDDRPDPRLTELSSVPAETVAQFDSYFRMGGPDNLSAALAAAATLAGTPHTAPLPRPLPAAIVTRSLQGAPHKCAFQVGQPRALVLHYRSSLMAGDSAAAEALAAALENHGIAAITFAVTSLKDPAAARTIEQAIVLHRPAVILNATAFSALRTDDTSVLDAADCPVLQVALSGASASAWTQSARGLSPTDLAMNVVLPELDGRLFTRAISFKAEVAAHPALEFSRVVHQPCADRVAAVAALAAAWVRLRTTPASERRIAIMLSDYPARAGRTGYAVGLDSWASAAAILEDLAADGYGCGAVVPTAEAICAALTETAPSLLIPLADYARWFAALPEPVQAAIIAAWGPPEQDPACNGTAFVLPVLEAGQQLVLVQPDRGSAADRKADYHDLVRPPRHAYVALYAWLREARGIHALVHLGTHGTLEWLPGKALALSRACYPEAVLGAVPVIYPFIVNNPGEAVQAKRRIAAVTLGHLTPPLESAGLDSRLAALEQLIEELAEAQTTDQRRARLLEAEIIDRARRDGLAAECGAAPGDEPRTIIAKLDARLCDIKDLSVRTALHVFGRPPAPGAQMALCHSITATAPGVDAVAVSARIAAAAAAERNGLAAALAGRRVAPGPAGAPSRGRFDVLPTGRNLTTLDPRAIPTRTAASLGARAAAEVIRRHLQDAGSYLRVVVIDLWASQTLRTGGDELAQALALLGCRPVWDHATARVTGVEVLPIALLEHPRVDVTIRASGLFRDLFQSQLALFDLAVGLVAQREEDDEWNPLAAARRASASLARAFAGAPGTFGAGAAAAALDGNWRSRDDLGAAYLAATTHAYGRDDEGTPAAAAFAARVAAADALIHVQDDAERDLLDGDGVADAMGGFAAAAAKLGTVPRLYHLDSSRPEAPRVRTAAEAVARIVRGRLANPRWLAGMLKHGHRGVAEIAQSVDALYAFAATTDAVSSTLFDLVHERLIEDAAVLAQLRSANRHATAAILERLDDALSRGLWRPRRNAVHSELAAARRPFPEAAE